MKDVLPTFSEELSMWSKGYNKVIGIDEVGRGAFAGPLVVAGVAFPRFFSPDSSSLFWKIRDSKMLSKRQREILSEYIYSVSAWVSVAEAGLSVINKLGIGKATQIAMRKIIRSAVELDTDFFVLVDGFHIRYAKGCSKTRQKAIPKGDQTCMSIAAASIVAKVHRDALMRKLHKQYPHYFFAQNKGYGTKAHQNAIKKYGLCRIHRTSFSLQKFL